MKPPIFSLIFVLAISIWFIWYEMVSFVRDIAKNKGKHLSWWQILLAFLIAIPVFILFLFGLAWLQAKLGIHS